MTCDEPGGAGSVDLCAACVDRAWTGRAHRAQHRLVAIVRPELARTVPDGDYTSEQFMGEDSYNYLDPVRTARWARASAVIAADTLWRR